ncbi:MAG TPA: lysophospholipid acyltransferase family protein [Candidatus Brocadiia bacterium]|nr:lysophospholipid acyltransferase family protein [Candidatus Brocadiia bacterium]
MFLNEIKFRIAGLLGYWVLRILASTWRVVEVPGDFGKRVTSEKEKFIHAFWHRVILIPAYTHRRMQAVALVSRHSDGEYIARIMQYLGYKAARGSSTRGGSEGLRELEHLALDGYSPVLTVDGPKGPRYVVKVGAVVLAMRTGIPLLPSGGGAWPQWVMPSWDGFIIPKPFARVVIYHGIPHKVPPDATPEEIERIRAEIEAELHELTRRGEFTVREKSGGVIPEVGVL